jgi:hypothetical protein
MKSAPSKAMKYKGGWNLRSAKWITVKGGLFLILAVLAGSLLFFEHPTARAALLLTLTIWASCRFYYFVFYVVEHWIDSDFRYSGLLSLFRHVISRNRHRRQI